MTRIPHCGTDRQVTKTYRLQPRILGYTEELLFCGHCRQCKHDIMMHGAWHVLLGIVIFGLVEPRDFENWEIRKKTDFIAEIEKRFSVQRPSRQAMYCSEYTLRIARGAHIFDSSEYSKNSNNI